ncbi:MAG: arylsulfatase [Planctomycetaceae bacterium]|nr:arylsulfatase [Planctomycetaceae bacterium]
MRYLVLTTLIVLGVGKTVQSKSLRVAAEPLPNIVLIMADDLGYGDIKCYNRDSKIPTPHIDRLASQGTRFTDAHSPAAVCVPTRYGLLTGRFPFRMQRRGNGPLLAPNRMTIGSLLSAHDYRTACIGKWHLGFENEKSPEDNQPLRGGPVDRGFSSFFGIPASLDIPPYYYINGDRCLAPPLLRTAASRSPDWSPIQGAFWRAGGIAPGFKHAEVTPRLLAKVVGFLDDHHLKQRRQPFFLYLALPSPHTPWLPVHRFQGKSNAGAYGDFVVQVDDVVGQVMKALQRNEWEQNTLVFFTSDNGPVWYPSDTRKYDHDATGGLRGMKGDAWEGGHRMPFIARWPTRVAAGRKSTQMICHTDVLATLADLLGVDLPTNAGEDSLSFLSELTTAETQGHSRAALIHQSSARVLSVRNGPWKLIPQLGSGGFTKPRRVKPQPGDPQGQLYNLHTDLAETTNVYKQHPDIVRRLTLIVDDFRERGRSRP